MSQTHDSGKLDPRKEIHHNEGIKQNMLEAHELKKTNIHYEIHYDRSIRQNVLESCESGKLNLREEFLNALVSDKLNIALRALLAKRGGNK